MNQTVVRHPGLLLVVLLAALSLACRNGPQAQGPPGMPVKIQVAQSVAVDDSSEYVATLKSRGSSAIMPQVEGHITVRVGDRVTVSTLLTTVDSPGIMEAYVSVPVERAPQLKPGLPVRIVDSTGNVLAESHVTFISPQVDDQTQTVLVKAGIANTGTLRPAQFIRARVVWGTRQGPVVPVLAVSRIS